MLFGNIKHNSKYEIFIICSCEGYLGIFYFSSSVPSAFTGKGEKWNTSKDVSREREGNWGVNSRTFWSFIL